MVLLFHTYDFQVFFYLQQFHDEEFFYHAILYMNFDIFLYELVSLAYSIIYIKLLYQLVKYIILRSQTYLY